MQIYLDLFYNNIESFLASTFPVARQILLEQGTWPALVREFVHRHGSESPYFLEISQEFLTFLGDRDRADLPDYLLELCHYEWVELSLDVAAEEFDVADADGSADALGSYQVSPLMRALVYDYPVHQIGEAFQPSERPAAPTFLIVYRNADLKVRFMESNPVTHRLVALLRDQTAQAALAQIGVELAEGGREIALEKVEAQGLQTLTHLESLGIIMRG